MTIPSRPLLASPPVIEGRPAFNALARRVFEKGRGKIEELERLAAQFRGLVGSESPEIADRIGAEKERLSRVLSAMAERYSRNLKYEGLSDSEHRLYSNFDLGNHERDPVFAAVTDPDVRLRLAMRAMDEEEYNSLRFGHMPEEKAPEPVPGRGEVVRATESRGDALVPFDAHTAIVASTREALRSNAHRIAGTVGLGSKAVRMIVAGLPEERVVCIHDYSEELGIEPHRIAAVDIALNEEGMPETSIVRRGASLSAMDVVEVETRIELAATICKGVALMQHSLASAFNEAYERAYAKRLDAYKRKLEGLRREIHQDYGPGREVEAEAEYLRKAEEVEFPRHGSWDPRVTLRSAIEISRLFWHDRDVIESFVEHFEECVDCSPSESERGTRARTRWQIAEGLGIGMGPAEEMAKALEDPPELRSYEPTAARTHKQIARALRSFIERNREVALDDSSKYYRTILRLRPGMLDETAGWMHDAALAEAK